MTLNLSRLAALLFAAIALPALAADNVAVVNGKPIPASRVDALAKQFISQGQKDTPELRDNIKKQLIEREILLQEAEKLKLGNDPDVKMQLDLAKQGILINALAEDFIKKHPVPDSEVAAEYEKIKAAHAGDKEYHIRHIQTDSEEEAKAIIAKLKSGAKFDDLAKQSKDVATANKGGDLDWVVLAGLDKPLADAISGLQKGQFTETPVKIQEGYHVIKLDDVRPAKIASMEDLKPRIVEALQRQKLQQYQKSLKDSAKVQ